MIQKITNNARTLGTDVSNLGDYSTMIITKDGEDIKIKLYGR